MQLVIADADVADRCEQVMQQGSPPFIDTGVVRAQWCQQIAFGLVPTILMSLTTACSLKVALRQPWERPRRFRGELRHATAGGAQPFVELCHGRS